MGKTVLAFVLTVMASAAFAHDVDLTKLPLGDGKLSRRSDGGPDLGLPRGPNGGGAQVDGPSINKAAGTYDFTKKAVVSGKVVWVPHFVMSLSGASRVFTSNDLPNHPTGTFPIPSTDEAYKYDRNPNAVREQSVTVTLPPSGGGGNAALRSRRGWDSFDRLGAVQRPGCAGTRCRGA